MRWRETLLGSGLVLIGLWWLIGPGQLLTLPSVALLVAGAALIWIGVQRARFRGDGEGPGAVQVDEGQIAYFGPLTGGAIALRELSRLTLDSRQFPAHWQLEQPGIPPVQIPVNAAGADALFDAFATLPGFRTERMLFVLKAKTNGQVVIWQREPSDAARLSAH